MALIIKVQANFRGFLARKKIRGMQYNAGMGGFNYEDGQQDYDNQKVQVSIKFVQNNIYFFIKVNQR